MRGAKNQMQKQRQRHYELSVRKTGCDEIDDLQIVAEQQGDIQKAQEFQRQIDELDNKTDRLDKERSKDIKGISWINQRNRNVIRNTVLSGKLKFDVTSEDDPFTRKKGVMKVVSGSKHAVGSSSQTQQPDV
ncbi:hypothetical protein WR25_24114 [Diploscapter pachys]|uniref:Uncharacterized protein n=1 Tax=Diploscapter pachys TaxID=2018661 RepID=A0A2A2K1Q2_9BILA|nr:hypothetical protein WR25_24114 [Diploscapter pachys]